MQILREIVHRYGTPLYAYDLNRIRGQMERLGKHVPSNIEILYSLKANGCLGLCRFIAADGFGADVASAGELVTALAAGFSAQSIFLTGPDKSSTVLEQLRRCPEVIVSLDSPDEFEILAKQEFSNRTILRLRPDFCSYASCAAGPDSRFGVPVHELPRCRELLRAHPVELIGFHVFSGSQVLDAAAVVHHLRGGVEQSLRAADVLGVVPQIIDLGGGFGVPYKAEEGELELGPIADELAILSQRVAPARIVLELGRYFVAQAGWYLTTVLSRQSHRSRAAVVVDGGSHQRADLCGLGLRRHSLPPFVLDERAGPLIRTDVLGCLSLPSDVLAEEAMLPPLRRGDLLAFPNAGAYGLAAAPLLFHGHVPPAEVAFDGSDIRLLRSRSLLTAGAVT
jgi:diaminopimelate decarboxylase